MAELSESHADGAVTPVKKRGGIADKLAAGLSRRKAAPTDKGRAERGQLQWQ